MFTVRQNIIACLLGKPIEFDQKVLDLIKHNQGVMISEAKKSNFENNMPLKNKQV